MRISFACIGVAAIALYAITGALLMNRWAVMAASEEPLAQTITAMSEAGQPYSAAPGYLFAGAGLALGAMWVLLVLLARSAMPGWAAVASWAVIVTCGAPAYFFTSFSNMNAVGDTFEDWNAEAAFTLEAPLYASSGIALLAAAAAVLVRITRAARHGR